MITINFFYKKADAALTHSAQCNVAEDDNDEEHTAQHIRAASGKTRQLQNLILWAENNS